MKFLIYTCVTALAISACGKETARTNADLLCNRIETDLPCVSNEYGIVLGTEFAQNELDAIAYGAVQFEKHFDKKTDRAALVMGGSISFELSATLKASGFPVTLPWVSADDKQKLLESSIRAQVEKQLQGQPQAVIDAAIQQAMAQAKAGETSATKEALAVETGALSHEFGHIWFIHSFQDLDPGHAHEGPRYGGWAPDLLDEAAAIMAENETLTKSRRKGIKDRGSLPNLKTLTEMEHPSLQAVAELEAFKKNLAAEKEGSAEIAIALSGEEAEKFMALSANQKPVEFYEDVRTFSDYLIYTSGHETILADITHAVANENFEVWLSKNDVGLPNNFADLQVDFENWYASQ